eukprot:g1854.t1
MRVRTQRQKLVKIILFLTTLCVASTTDINLEPSQRQDLSKSEAKRKFREFISRKLSDDYIFDALIEISADKRDKNNLLLKRNEKGNRIRRANSREPTAESRKNPVKVRDDFASSLADYFYDDIFLQMTSTANNALHAKETVPPVGFDPATGLSEPTGECRRVLNTWLGKCVFQASN